MKSFFAGSVEAALGMAREELGTEAILVNSRKSPPEARHLGEYEVVAAALPPVQSGTPLGSGQVKPASSLLDADTGGLEAAQARFAQEMAELRRQMERTRKAIWQSSLTRIGHAGACGQTGALAALLEAGVEPCLAQEIAVSAEARLGEEVRAGVPLSPRQIEISERAWLEALSRELPRWFSVEPVLGVPGARQKIVALAGPPGTGKSATIAKLAVSNGIRCGRATHIISMDTYRIAATEPLRTYAALLGVGFETVETPGGLSNALAACIHKDLVLIDTPGYGPRDHESALETARILTDQPEIDVHLALAATTKSADLTSVVERFEIFRPAKLIFTRLDETSLFGPAFSEAALAAKPISFLTNGQTVPEDLEEASKERVVELLLDRGGH
jgi:flagellar biosynthesis protein FlhF